MVIWLKGNCIVENQFRITTDFYVSLGARSPKHIYERVKTDEEFKRRLIKWLESIIKLDLPTGTVPLDEGLPIASQKKCLLGRPPHPDDVNFPEVWPQFLREVLDASSQVHTHSETCFKKTPLSISQLRQQDQDRLCRFNYPFELVPETSIDEHGKISLKRHNAYVVGYNPTISGSFQCNTDLKFIGSGPLGQAISIYICNYTAKFGLDSAVIMSALSAALKALEPHSNHLISPDDESCRKLILKTLNQINGRRELSGQQVACALLGIGNHMSDAKFAVFHWSKLLSWISVEDFPPYAKTNDNVRSAISMLTKFEI
jgi:hypothetical protein